MMRADEEQTLVDLQAHLTELVKPVVERFHGRIVKTVGDGVMAEFGSAVEAVRSAVELQRGMAERNAGLPETRRQSFRIGLNLGDVIESAADLFGDTVNVAARLQALAEPGSIALSRSVYEQVRDKLSLPFRDLGGRALKNIDRPLHVYVLDGAALPVTARWQRGLRRFALSTAAVLAAAAIGAGVFVVAGGRNAIEAGLRAIVRPAPDSSLSVAVLLFTNQSGDPGQEYFSDGLTEDITRALGRFKPLTVLAYGAVLPYRGSRMPPMEIGRALNARYLVAGSVRRSGPRLRVTAQLTDASNGTQLWAGKYDDLLTDIFEVQERIARQIAGVLAINLQQIALQQSLRKPPDNLDAYDMMLRARARANEATLPANRMAREMLGRVTEMAPSYADGYAELADATFSRATYGWSEFPEQDVEEAIRLARKAIELDGDCVLAHSVLARAYTARLMYDLGLAESERALQINPSDTEALAARAAVLLWTGRIDESITAAELANRLDSNLGPEVAFNLGIAYLLSRRYADAIKLLEAARVRYPTYPLLDFPLAGAYAESGRTAEAHDALERGRSKSPYIDLVSFGTRFQTPSLKRQLQDSLRKAGLD